MTDMCRYIYGDVLGYETRKQNTVYGTRTMYSNIGSIPASGFLVK